MCVIWDHYVDLYVLISLGSNYHVILQKLSGHNVCVEIIESLSTRYKAILQNL